MKKKHKKRIKAARKKMSWRKKNKGRGKNKKVKE